MFETYTLIRPPFDTPFREMSKTQMNEYRDWFLDEIPKRIRSLAGLVHETPAFDNWTPDLTVESVDRLSEWLVLGVHQRPRTESEVKTIKERIGSWVPVPVDTITDESVSIGVDVGVYLSQVLIGIGSALHWKIQLGSKNNAYYGQPVLSGFRAGVVFNPVTIGLSVVQGVAGSRSGTQLREAFDWWAPNAIAAT